VLSGWSILYKIVAVQLFVYVATILSNYQNYIKSRHLVAKNS